MAISTTAPAYTTGAAAVTCPGCGASIPITEALSHQAREAANREYTSKERELEARFAEREQRVTATQREIEAQRAKLNDEIAARLQAEKAAMLVALRKEVESQKGHELTVLQEQLARRNQQIVEAGEKELALLRQKAALEEKERQWKVDAQAQLEATRAKVEAELATRYQKQQLDAAAKLRQEIEAQKSTETAALRQQLEARDRAIAAANAKEIELLKQKEELELRRNAMELEVARKMDEERGRIAEQARAGLAEQMNLKLLEKEKLADDLRRQIETLQQKANQGSMQLQGEVLEIDFEAKLRAQFAQDDISPISTGQRGADVQQVVRTGMNNVCGTILWEAKRTRTWSATWIPKLKADQRQAQAELAIIVTQALPKDVTNFGCVDGVWVTDFASALPLAMALRQGLLNMAAVRQAETGKHGKMEELYGYLTSTDFRQKIEAIVEAFSAMRKDLEAERTAMERIWAKREKQLRLALSSTAQLYGSVQGVLGAAALPDVPSLALPAAE